MPSSDNGLYLARTVAPVLTKALAEVYIFIYIYIVLIFYI